MCFLVKGEFFSCILRVSSEMQTDILCHSIYFPNKRFSFIAAFPTLLHRTQTAYISHVSRLVFICMYMCVCAFVCKIENGNVWLENNNTKNAILFGKWFFSFSHLKMFRPFIRFISFIHSFSHSACAVHMCICICKGRDGYDDDDGLSVLYCQVSLHVYVDVE